LKPDLNLSRKLEKSTEMELINALYNAFKRERENFGFLEKKHLQYKLLPNNNNNRSVQEILNLSSFC